MVASSRWNKSCCNSPNPNARWKPSLKSRLCLHQINSNNRSPRPSPVHALKPTHITFRISCRADFSPSLRCDLFADDFSAGRMQRWSTSSGTCHRTGPLSKSTAHSRIHHLFSRGRKCLSGGCPQQPAATGRQLSDEDFSMGPRSHTRSLLNHPVRRTCGSHPTPDLRIQRKNTAAGHGSA